MSIGAPVSKLALSVQLVVPTQLGLLLVLERALELRALLGGLEDPLPSTPGRLTECLSLLKLRRTTELAWGAVLLVGIQLEAVRVALVGISEDWRVAVVHLVSVAGVVR